MVYTANLVGPNGGTRLTQADLDKDGVDFHATASLIANINLHMTAQFGGSAINPSVQTDFVLAWTTTGDPTWRPPLPSSASLRRRRSSSITPDGQRQNFFQEFMGPILQNIHSVTEPLEPILAPCSSSRWNSSAQPYLRTDSGAIPGRHAEPDELLRRGGELRQPSQLGEGLPPTPTVDHQPGQLHAKTIREQFGRHCRVVAEQRRRGTIWLRTTRLFQRLSTENDGSARPPTTHRACT